MLVGWRRLLVLCVFTGSKLRTSYGLYSWYSLSSLDTLYASSRNTAQPNNKAAFLKMANTQTGRETKKKQCHAQTSVFSWDGIWLALLLTDIFTQWLVIVITAILQRKQSAMQTSFQHLKLQRLGCNLTENTKLYLNLLHTNRRAEQVLTLLLFGTYAWKLNLFPWQWQNPMACSAASVAMTTAH